MNADAIAKLRLLVLAWRSRAAGGGYMVSEYDEGLEDACGLHADELEAIIAEHVQ